MPERFYSFRSVGAARRRAFARPRFRPPLLVKGRCRYRSSSGGSPLSGVLKPFAVVPRTPRHGGDGPSVVRPHQKLWKTTYVKLYTARGIPQYPQKDSVFASVSSQPSPHALTIVLAATIAVPLLVLIVDYVFRTETGLKETMRNSGPDLCLLGLGSVGSVFLDPQVATAFFIPPQLAGALVVLIIFILRGFCFRLEKQAVTTTLAVGTMMLGLASIFIVGSILVYA